MTLQVVLVALLGIGATVKAADYRRSIGTTRLLVGLVSAGLLALALGQVISFPVVTAFESIFPVVTARLPSAAAVTQPSASFAAGGMETCHDPEVGSRYTRRIK